MNDDDPAGSGDDMTELYDADVPRVDLVGKAANGTRFLLMKNSGPNSNPGIMPAAVIRDLIDTDPQPLVKDTITMTGSPAAIAAMIANAPVRQPVEKKTFDTAERKKDAASGAAMPDGSYPIENKSQLEDAIRAVGRGKGSHDAIRRHIMSRAKSLGATSSIPDDWNSDGSIKKAAVDVPDSDEPLDTADSIADDTPQMDGDPDDPDSPAWEAVDAARACQAIDLTVALRRLVCAAQEREQLEAAVDADPDDANNALDLQDVLCAIDCILGVLAPFAVSEQAEADERQAELAKGLIVKAGRVLSGVNEQRITAAHQALTDVLASLPAPTEEAPVEKETDPTVPAQADEPVGKAKGDPQVAVYTADGKLVGVVDQSDISPIAAPAAPEGGDEQGGGEAGGDKAADETPAAEPEPADDTQTDDAAPDTEDAKTIPGTNTVQAPPDNDNPDDVTKTLAEALTKQLAEQAELVKSLQERIDKFGLTPDDRNSPIVNTAANRTPDTDDPIGDMVKQAETETDPKRKQELAMAAAFATIRKAQADGGRKFTTVEPSNFADVLARFTR